MNTARKRKNPVYPSSIASGDKQEELRAAKLKIEQVKEVLERKVLDNPETAKKAALILAMWLEKKPLKRK